MRFIVGLATGIVVGFAGAVAYTVSTGRDLREEFEGVRSDLSRRDFDALGSRLESRVAEMQTQLEERIATVREQAAGAAADAGDAVAAAGAEAGEAVESAGDAVADAAEATAESLEVEQEKPEG